MSGAKVVREFSGGGGLGQATADDWWAAPHNAASPSLERRFWTDVLGDAGVRTAPRPPISLRRAPQTS